MTTILLADIDEARLEELSSIIQAAKPDWEVVALTSAADVLQCASNDDIHCVVTDYDLQDSNGIDLLKNIQIKHPNIVRLTVSANQHHDVVQKSTVASHRFVERTVPDEVLVGAIECSLRLKNLLSDASLTQCMSEIRTLPSLPEIYQQMVSELTAPQSSLQNIARIIESDNALTVTVLKIVNSAFYGLNQRVESVSHGVALLGVHLIKNITLTAKVFAQFQGSKQQLLKLQQLNDGANRTGALANQFARLSGVSRSAVDHAQIAGMLSNIGELVELSRATKESSEDLEANIQGEANIQAKNNMRASIELQGAYLLRLWSLPDPVVEAVAMQYESPPFSKVAITPLIILHAIRYLEQNFSDPIQKDACSAYLEQIVSTKIASLWIDAYNDLQALTSHTNVDG